MLKLRTQLGEKITIAGSTAIQLLSIIGSTARLRIDSSSFCSVVVHTSVGRRQSIATFSDESQTHILSEGSTVNVDGCTLFVASIGPNAVVCQFHAPRSIEIGKSKAGD